MKEYKIDAKDQRLGRVSSQIASFLMGKNLPDFSRNKVSDVRVFVENVSLLNIDPKKKDDKLYSSYSGFPSGRKEVSLRNLATKKGYGEVLKKAVFGMLPSNKLRSQMMKNLVINE